MTLIAFKPYRPNGMFVMKDECFVGGIEANKHEHKKLKAGRGTVGKTPVLGMRERGGRTVATPISRLQRSEPRL